MNSVLSASGRVAISAFWGLYGPTMDWECIQVYPAGVDPFGNDVLTSHALHWFDGNGQAYTSNGAFQWQKGKWIYVSDLPSDPVVYSEFLRSLRK